VALAADLAAVDAAIADALGTPPPPHAPPSPLAALRRLLFVGDGELARPAAAPPLAALAPTERLLFLLSRAPPAVAHPASSHASPAAFVAWLDGAPPAALADAADAAVAAAGSAPSLEAGWDGGVAPALAAAVKAARSGGGGGGREQ
jgi:hypothetical protein